MIEAKQVRYGIRSREILRGVDFRVEKGEFVGLIGPNGSGKSTFLKNVYKVLRPQAGELTLMGDDLLAMSNREMAQRLAVMVQEQEAAFDFTVEEVVMMGRQAGKRLLETDSREDRALVGEILARTGLASLREQGFSTLSGGERVKLRLALLLLDDPDVLLLDEPSNDLDLDTLTWLEGFLLSCQAPVLYISHDETLLERTANVVIHLERLRRRTLPRCTVARTDYRSYVSARQAGFAHQEQVARKERAEFDAKLERFRQIRDKVDHQQATISRQDPHGGRLLKKKMHAVQSLGRRFEREREDMTQMPEWEEAILTAFDSGLAALPAGKTVLRLDLPELRTGEQVLSRNLRLWVTGPEKIGIVGANGAGKSTLLKLVADELLPRTDLRAAYMAQDYGDQLLEEKTPVDILAPSGKRDDITQARTLLGAMKYKAEEMEHPAAWLSGGQRAKLLFLSMVLNGSNVLVLDEPTRNFSPLSAPIIRQVLADFPGCIISVSHDRLYLSQVCGRVLELTGEGLVPASLN